MKLQIYENYDEMSAAAARLITDQVRRKPASLICLPSGDSPLGVFKLLMNYSAEGEVDFSDCYFAGLDEWIGLGRNDDGSCTNFLFDNFFGPLQIREDKMMFFDACSGEPDKSCKRMDAFIKLHGPLDIMLVGIGMNGHIGLNEPGCDFNRYSHWSALDPVTVTVAQKYFKTDTSLNGGITLGLQHLQEAKIPVLIASGKKKAEIIGRSLEGEVSSQVPASIFQRLGSGLVMLTEDAATQLTNR